MELFSWVNIADLALLVSCPWGKSYRGICQWTHWGKHTPKLYVTVLACVSCSLQEKIVSYNYFATKGNIFLKNKYQIERVRVSVKYPGCESTTAVVKVCNGACISSHVLVLSPLFLSLTCTGCRAIQYRTKPERITFICDGVEFVHRVYLPTIEDCACIHVPRCWLTLIVLCEESDSLEECANS